MFKALMARFHQGHRTTKYPDSAAQVPELFRGYPRFHQGAAKECRNCEESCPTGALTCAGTPSLDLGACLFCAECPAQGDTGCLHFTADPALAATSRENLVITPQTERRYAQALDDRLRKLFGRSLKLREVSAGGCNACEADTNVLSTIGFDVGRFGIQFVASPRHADGIFVTGPVTENMRVALLKTYEAIPEPKVVIASGACAISGGPFIGSPEQHHGVATFLPVDLYIPGCPPHPITILDGLLRLLGRMKDQHR